MVSFVEIKGFDNFSTYTDSIDDNGPPVFFYFSGSKTADGNSWCPDCVEVSTNAMVKYKLKTHYVNNYQEFTEFVEKLPEKCPPVYFMFIGQKKENGASWCIYCIMAEPIVKAYLSELKKSVIFVYVDVGDREYWKDKACPFRTDSRTRLMVIPTILRWKGVQRLEGSQCNNRELLQMLFEEEDE